MKYWNKLLSILKTFSDYYPGFEEIIKNTIKSEEDYAKLLDYIDMKHIKSTNECIWYAINIKYKTI